MTTNLYKVFVASSLGLENHRKVISEALNDVNQDETVKNSDIMFEEFLYEKNSNITQNLKKKDAQAPADTVLKQSPIFFLVIDDVIRNLTCYEFELALDRFDKGLMPQYVYVFHKKNTADKSSDDGIDYDSFTKRYNLNDYFYDKKSDVIRHRRVYDVPYENLTTGKESLKERVIFEMQRLVKSGELPFPESQQGYMLDKNTFYADDPQRRDNCPDIYYRRDVDDDIDEALETKKIVLVTGPSLCGKTRSIMEALRKRQDGWVYVLDINSKDFDTEKKIEHKLKQLTAYISKESVPKLYIVIDNIDNLFGEESFSIVMKGLIGTVMSDECKAVLVATSSDTSLIIGGVNKGDNRVGYVKINEMSDQELDDAYRFFLSSGITTIDKKIIKYRMTGAFFVNIEDIKTRYYSFLRGSGLGFKKSESQELDIAIRGTILKVIKAQSIWRSDHLGDSILMRDMTYWLLRKEYDVDIEKFNMSYDDAMHRLCSDGRMGITKDNRNGRYIIQEYVYRYFIDYDGTIQDDHTSDQNVTVPKEKNLIKEIILFCADLNQLDVLFLGTKQIIGNEPLTYQVSRIIRRCVHKTEISHWLYCLWLGEDGIKPEFAQLSTLLREDRQKCERNINIGSDNTLIHHYSVIIETYLYHSCPTFESALNAYNKCATNMKTDHLFAALMRKALSEEERIRVCNIPDYLDFACMPYVIRAEAEWTEDYPSAINILRRFKRLETNAQIAQRLLSSDKIQYDILQLSGILDTVCTRIKYEDELEDFLLVMRDYYMYLITNHTLLEKIQRNEGNIDLSRLTKIDLLAKLGNYQIGVCISNVFHGDVEAIERFISNLTSEVDQCIDAGFITENELRLTLGYIGSCFIKNAACAGEYYDKVYRGIFLKLEVPHPRKSNVTIILRNSFSYTNIMMCRDCDIVKALNLFENDLVKHAKDLNNPLYINRFTLNEILKKCIDGGKNNSASVNRVNALFDQLGVGRDEFTYTELLKQSKSLNESLDLIMDMEKNGIKPGKYPLLAVQLCDDVDFSMSLNFVKFSADSFPQDFHIKPIPTSCDEQTGNILNIDKYLLEFREFYGDDIMAWKNVLSKPCRSQVEKQAYCSCIDYLEKEKTDLLLDGNLYNTVISNADFLQDIFEAIDFIKVKKTAGLFQPDYFTSNHLVDIVCAQNSKIKLSAAWQLCDFIKDNPTTFSDYLVNNRLHMYDGYVEQLPQVFFSEDKMAEECTLLIPIGYIEAMQEHRLIVNSYTIRHFFQIKGNPTENMYKRLMNVLVRQQEYYEYNNTDSETIRRFCQDYIDRYPIKLAPQSALDHNKTVDHRYKIGKYTVNEALSSISWENEDAAVTAFNSIVSRYIDNSPKDSLLFKGVMGYYNMYFNSAENHYLPSSYTFSVLAKAVTTKDEFKELLSEYNCKKELNSRLVLQPHMLSRLSAILHTVKDLKEETRAFINIGGQVNSKAADTYIYRLEKYYINTDPEATIAILHDLSQYILFGGDAKTLLRNDERECLMLNLYEKPVDVSAEALLTIIKYINSKHNRTPSVNHLPLSIGYEQMVDIIANKYSHCMVELMELLVRDRTMPKMAEAMVPRLFYSIPSFSRPNLSQDLLQFLAARLKKFDTTEYNNLLHTLYVIDCRQIECIVPKLVECIHRWSKDHADWAELATIRKVESQIRIYSEIGKLRCGHLLIEKAPVEYVDWCRHSLRCDEVLRGLDETIDTPTLEQKLKFYVSNLDDAYMCGLTIVRMHISHGDIMDEQCRTILSKQEQI